MNINNELVQQVKEGTHCIWNNSQRTDKVNRLIEVVHLCFPEDFETPDGKYNYYYATRSDKNYWMWSNKELSRLTPIPLDLFFVVEEEKKNNNVEHLKNIKLLTEIYKGKKFYVECYPTDTGALCFPNTNLAVKEIDLPNFSITHQSSHPPTAEGESEIISKIEKLRDNYKSHYALEENAYSKACNDIIELLSTTSEPINLEDVREQLRHNFYKSTGRYAIDSPYEYLESLEKKIAEYKAHTESIEHLRADK